MPTALGRNKVTRLLHVARTSPSVGGPALTLALNAIKALTLDTRLYEETYYQYRQLLESLAGQTGDEADSNATAWLEQSGAKDHPEPFDREWVEQSKHEAQAGLDRLEIELKGYLTNLIKESIRVRFLSPPPRDSLMRVKLTRVHHSQMGHRDLARYQYRTGDLQGAVRSYTKSREYGSTSQHILEMCLGVIEVRARLSLAFGDAPDLDLIRRIYPHPGGDRHVELRLHPHLRCES